MEDLLRDNPTPEGWSESETNDEKNSSSNESEEDKDDEADCLSCAKNFGTSPERNIVPFHIIENIDDSQIMDNSVQLMDGPAIIEDIEVNPAIIEENSPLVLENKAPILENPAQILENVQDILENPAQILENPVQIQENTAQIPDNLVHILENPAQIPEHFVHILENSAQYLANPAQIPENFVHLLENPTQYLENSVQIMNNPAMFIIENPGQILQILQEPINLREPNTTVRKMPEADPRTLEHYMVYQKLRQPNWKSVKYGGVKDQFQVSPGFCALKPNDLLEKITPDSKYNDQLKRFDLTCGAMFNGLVQNYTTFNETLNTLPTSMKNEVYEMFYGLESKYKKHSDGLLQYICGRRQEIMQDRRKLYKPRNKIHKKALYNIPPSEIHLFEDDAFTNLVAQMKGIDKIFPTEKKRILHKHRVNQNQEHRNRRKMEQNINRETRRSD